MFVSMTGFGSATLTKEWGSISLELSSVNHRYQEISVRLPRELLSWESWFHQRLRRSFRRGKILARVETRWNAASLAMSIHREVLEGYYRDLSEMRESLGIGAEIRLDSLLTLPGVMDVQEKSCLTDGGETEGILTELLESCVRSWNNMRHTEGCHLEADIMKSLALLEDHVNAVSEMWKDARDAAFTAMTDRVRTVVDLLDLPAVGESRFAQEAVLIADRWDISEELVRMRSHAAKFREAGSSLEPMGRKLDFLLQEMNREVNTISSKAHDSNARWRAVEIKVELERIREQIQNLE
ncbi:MAG: YicC family protein [Synergistaceae bacterium]|jgi:uncharacterized protein (TIGR00255 family)|nr:YicC family protein [Synergistaceae bacterium]